VQEQCGESVAGVGKDSQMSDQKIQPLSLMNDNPLLRICQC
jgi:hypothetical protein